MAVADAYAQQNLNVYAMPSATVKYALSKSISQSFTVEDRTFLYRNSDYEWQLKHIELSHFTKLEVKKNRWLALGLSYRFEGETKHEREFRLMQQFEWRKDDNAVFKHRIRTEQRIYPSATRLRLRYQTKYSQETDFIFDKVSVINEVMVEKHPQKKPEYEERLALYGEWEFNKHISLEVGTQYRLSNFTHRSRTHNIFLCTGLNVVL